MSTPHHLLRRLVRSVGVIVSTCACLALIGERVSAQSKSAPATKAGRAAEKQFEDFDPRNFDRPTQVDNVWMPLMPGTRFVYDGRSEDKGKPERHHFVVNVTDLTKMIGGVRARITYDLDYRENELEEAELAFYAQDNDGNIWRMGEYPEEYSGGKFVAASPWIHGIEGARAGIEMKAKPMSGAPSYSQGWGPAVNWTDRAQVLQTGQKTTVPAGTYDDVVVIAESSASEPNARQLKYFARGVGNVRVGWQGKGEITKEVLELTKIETLDAKAIADVRAEALKLDKSGYQRSKKAYALTPPAEAPPATDSKPTAK